MAAPELLETALSIGRRLAHQARWQGEICTWDVQISVPDRQQRTSTAEAGGQLYQGTAGIAWFLGELYRASGEAELARAARGGLAHALQAGRELSVPDGAGVFGFHVGRVGIAWAAVRLTDLLEHPDAYAAARELLRPLVGHADRDTGLDVVAGAAGAIPACLDLAETTGWNEPLELARGLGEHLLHQARRAPSGWSWPTGGPSAVHDLAGFGHGASGIGLALLELARATGDGRFRFAAEMAFLYERQYFDPETSNWPDLRHEEIGESLFFDPPETLRRAAVDETFPPYVPRYMTAWCHGSPGIGLARLRAWELTGQDAYRREAEAALRSTLKALEEDLSDDSANYSLCHGIGGNCELLTLAAELLERPELRRVAERAALAGVGQYETVGHPWPCGTVGSFLDPGLLLGEAGIGIFLLRLAKPEIPSILLLRPHAVDDGSKAWMQAPGFEELAKESATDFFATTLAAWQRLDPPGPILPTWKPLAGPLERAPARDVDALLAVCLGNAPAEIRELLEDASAPERLRYDLTQAPQERTQDVLRHLVRPPWEEIDPHTAQLFLAPDARLVMTAYAWQAWLASPELDTPEEDGETYLCHLQESHLRCRVVSPIVALILHTVVRTAGLPEIMAQIAEAAGVEPTDETLAATIPAQLRELYEAGLIDCRPRVDQDMAR